MSLIIGLDFDGVMGSTIKLKHRMAKELYGVEGISDNRFKEGFVVDAGLMTKQQYRAMMNIVCGDRSVGLAMEPITGVDIYVPQLKKEGHRLIVITSREGSELDVVKEWCELRNFDLEYRSVGYGKDKKAAAADVSVYIDDDVSKLIPLIGSVPHLFLFTQEHNADTEVPESIVRVHTWESFYTSIQQL